MQDAPLLTAFTVPLDDIQLNNLGTLSVLWSQFEFLVEAAIYDLRDESLSQGRDTTLPRDISKRLHTLAGLAGDRLEKAERMAVIDVCERGQIAALERNVAVHGHWTRERPGSEARAVSWFKVPNGERLSILPISDIPALLRETAEIGFKLYQVFERRALLSSWRDTRL